MISNILKGLNAMQKEAVCHKDGPLLILAGAGSGKTSVITRRIAALIENGVAPYNIMAITFTNKAAAEMKERVAKILDDDMNSVFVSTFHSACVRFLRRDIDRLGYGRDFTIYDTTDTKAVVKACVKRLDLDPKIYKEKSVLGAISNLKSAAKSSVDSLGFSESNEYERNLKLIYNEYQKRLRDNNALDFDDLILKTVELLSKHEDIRGYYSDRFKYIMVDEYQDTNNSQFELIRLLATHKNLCVVGDDDQSIYRFRGANISNILNFEKYFENAKVIKLEQNYRSTSQILDCANAVVSNNKSRKAKRLWTDNNKGELPQFWEFETGYDEAGFVIKEIRDLVSTKGYNYSDFAILYRANSQSRLFEEKAVFYNIPYKLIGGVNFYSRAEIKDILAYLRLLINTSDDVSLQRIVNIPKRGIGNTTIAKLVDFAADNNITLYQAMIIVDEIPSIAAKTKGAINSFCQMIESLKEKRDTVSVKGIIELVCERSGYMAELVAENTDEANGRIENIGELVSKAADYDIRNENPSLSGFLEDVALISDIDTLVDDDYVVMMTLHGSKGLEFDNVYLTGMEQGMFPSFFAINNDDETQIEEERRLCYVGITRAKKVLKLTAADKRMNNGQLVYGKPSCFIEEIPPHMLKMMGPVGHTDYDLYDSDYGYGSYNAEAAHEPQYSSHIGKSKNDNADQSFSFLNKKSGFNKADAQKFLQTLQPKNKPIEKKLPDYLVGDSVKHIKYGIGIVTSISDAGRDYQVTVDFEGTGTKILLAGFAKLIKV